VPFRPFSVTILPSAQVKFDKVERLAADGKQPGRAIWKGFHTAIARIKADGQWGEVIPPSSIPEVYLLSIGVRNLYCVDLPAFHRMFYTIRGRDVVVIDLVDHDEYNRLMKT
jgi:hypothetical protein